MAQCVATLTPRKTVLFQNHWNERGSGQQLVHDWFIRGSEAENSFESLIYVWFAFNGWGQSVTEEEQDRPWLDIVGVNSRMRTEFQGAVESDESLRQAVNALGDYSPIFRSVQQRQIFDPPVPGTRQDDVKHWLSKPINGKPLAYRPQCYEDHIRETGVMDKDWPHILQAIYGVRCNLFHGGKSISDNDDPQLVTWSRDILVRFLTMGGYLSYEDPKSQAANYGLW